MVSARRRRRWHDTVSPRWAYLVGSDPTTWADGVRPLARRIAGRSVGVVLGGGRARAFAHIGVVEELESAGIVVDRVAGTSAGAIIGACYAAGLDADRIDALCFEEFVRRNPFRKRL
ncbi:MAG: patatin-like phospholipase family protein [Pseudonocardiaceae bacterium]